MTSEPSAYAVLAASSADVAAAVNFAREHHVRLVVKGGGHSYIGDSNAPDSLLIWTRPNMQDIELHDSFVPQGAAGLVEPEAAVSVGAGAIWMDAYNAVTTIAGRYVQGGGCTTVGVAGLMQGGGFGSFSKGFGTAAANLLEAEVVTADGTVRVANAVQNPDLFWALKGGGGGTFGVVTRLTLRTHPLPDYFGVVSATITATSDAAYLALVEQMISFYRESLLNPHWGEQINFAGNGTQITICMLFQGLTQAQAEQTWAPLFDWVTARPADYTLTKPGFLAVPAQDFWNGRGRASPRLGRARRPPRRAGGLLPLVDQHQRGGSVAAHLPVDLAVAAASRPRKPAGPGRCARPCQPALGGSLDCNKGLAGAPANALRWTADTSMNPAVLDSFALAIAAAKEHPAYPGIPGHEPNVAQGRQEAEVVTAAMAPLKAFRRNPPPTSTKPIISRTTGRQRSGATTTPASRR